MAVTKSVAQPLHKFSVSPYRRIVPDKNGVLTLSGYGISVKVDRGHLVADDGIGRDRHFAKLARVNHGLNRLVLIGEDGFISLAALRWLSDQKASFVMLDRNGSVLCTTGPVRSSDARLRRIQARADESDLGFRIAQELIRLKLVGQERVAREKLCDMETAKTVASFQSLLSQATTIEDIRICEARAAAAYWRGWHPVEARFPQKDILRVPEHWRIFGSRTSPLSSFSPRVAINPINAMLNYLYAVLEAETSLALRTMGLDPGMGFLHADYEKRESLSCDLMEAVRPEVDAFLFDWINRSPLNRDWFFEQRDGNCRLMASLAAKLSSTAPTWRQAVAPLAEWLARTLWEESPKMSGHRAPSSRLTQRAKRLAHGSKLSQQLKPSVKPPKLCITCGAPILHTGIYCRICNAKASKVSGKVAADLGRKAALSATSQAKRTASSKRHMEGRKGWIAANQPAWLDHSFYVEKIQPLLAGLTSSSIASAIGVSLGYADDIRKGKVHPHARHWLTLAVLVGIDGLATDVDLM